MSKDLSNWLALIVVMSVTVMILVGMFNFGSTVENVRLYKSCLVEQQNKIHKEAVELCKERTKE